MRHLRACARDCGGALVLPRRSFVRVDRCRATDSRRFQGKAARLESLPRDKARHLRARELVRDGCRSSQNGDEGAERGSRRGILGRKPRFCDAGAVFGAGTDPAGETICDSLRACARESRIRLPALATHKSNLGRGCPTQGPALGMSGLCGVKPAAYLT